MKRYNSSVEILRQNGHKIFVDLTWEKASDVTSSIYTINVADDGEMPIWVKRTAADIVNLKQRLSEEECYLRREMETCVKTFYDTCVAIQDKCSTFERVDDVRDDEDDSNVVKGLYSLKKKELHQEYINLFVACNLFKCYIKIPAEVAEYLQQRAQLPGEIMENDIVDEIDDELCDDEHQDKENEVD